MSRLFSKTNLHVMLGFTYTGIFFNEGLNCQEMTEQKSRDAKPRHIAWTKLADSG